MMYLLRSIPVLFLLSVFVGILVWEWKRRKRRVLVYRDIASDVLYVYHRDTMTVSSVPLEGDDFVILEKNSRHKIVGLYILCVSEMTARRWREHFHTGEIPDELFLAVHSWLSR